MIHTGLVSITFRNLTPEEIVAQVARAGLEGIEWGGDIHVPHGDLTQARHVRALTQSAGLVIPSYGSYYRVGHGTPVPFESVLETAIELGAPLVRVWAGTQGSDTADEAYWARVIADSQRIADQAALVGIKVAYEFHGRTLTDTYASALKLLEAVGSDTMKTYWQPPVGMTLTQNLEGLRAILPYLSNVHVFSWREGSNKRLLLEDGESNWAHYWQEIVASEREHFAMIEFVRDDAPENFQRDAATLKRWLQKS